MKKNQKSFLKGKKAQLEILWNAFIQIFFVIVIAGFFIFFISSNTKPEFMEQKVLVKEVAMLIDSSQPNTTIEIASPYIINFDFQNQTVSVEKYTYSFFNTKFRMYQEGELPNIKYRLIFED